MLRLWIILTGVSVCALIAASCAQMETAEEGAQAAQAATIASTEAVAGIGDAATQISGAISPTQSNFPTSPGTTVVETPDSYVLVKNGQVTIISKSSLYGYNGGTAGK